MEDQLKIQLQMSFQNRGDLQRKRVFDSSILLWIASSFASTTLFRNQARLKFSTAILGFRQSYLAFDSPKVKNTSVFKLLYLYRFLQEFSDSKTTEKIFELPTILHRSNSSETFPRSADNIKWRLHLSYVLPI